MNNQSNGASTTSVEGKTTQNVVKIELPSKGKIYPKDSVLSNGFVELRYMTGNDEMIVMNPSWIQEGTNLDKLLDAVVTTQGFNSLDLVTDDRMFLIVSARVMNVGVEYPLEYIKCPHCNHLHKKPTLTLEDIRDEEFNYPKNDFVNEYDVTLPQTKHKIKIKKLNGHDKKFINERISKVEKNENYFKQLVLLTRSQSILDSPVVGDNLGKKFDFLMTLPFKDSKYLANNILKTFGIIDPIIEFECKNKSCSKIIEVPVEISENFFFTES
jgi:hypothetical protein